MGKKFCDPDTIIYIRTSKIREILQVRFNSPLMYGRCGHIAFWEAFFPIYDQYGFYF